MAEHPANIDSLRALGSKVRTYAEGQDRTLEDEIGIISNSNAASGMFKSGRTIKEVIRVCCTLIKNRAELTVETIRKLPFSYSASLESALKENVRQYFPDDLGGFQVKVRNLVRKAGGENLEDVALEEIRSFQKEAVAGLLSDIDQYLVSLKHTHRLSNIERGFLAVELTGLAGTAFLAGLWVADKNGNYEPFIVLLTVITGGLEIYRRVKHKHAT